MGVSRFAWAVVSGCFCLSAVALHDSPPEDPKEIPTPRKVAPAPVPAPGRKEKPPAKAPELKLYTEGSTALKHFKTGTELSCPRKDAIDRFHDTAKRYLTYHRTKGEADADFMEAMRAVLEKGGNRPWRAEDFDDPALRWPAIGPTLLAAKKRVTDTVVHGQIDLVLACVEHFQHEFDEAKKKVFAGDPIPKDALPFDEKFKRQRAGKRGHVFKAGETVLGSLILEDVFDEDGKIKEDEVRFLIADDNSDVRDSDSFVVKVSKEKRRALQALKGIPIEGALKIKAPIGEGGAVVSNMYSYEADIVAIKTIAPVNPSAEKLAKLPAGSNAVVEGEVVKLYSATGDKAHPTHMYVKQSDGTITPVSLSSGLPKFESDAGSGVQNIEGKPVTVGDKVRVRGTVRVNRGDAYAGLPADQAPGKNPEKVVDAAWTRSTYLREPSKDRREEYDRDRESAKIEFEQAREYLANKDWEGLKQILSRLLFIELTAEEKARLNALRLLMPEDKRPVNFNEKYYTKEIDAGFGVQTSLMTKKEFVDFAMKLARREIRHDKNHGSASDYVVRLLDNKALGLTVDERRSILKAIADARLAEVKARLVEDKSFKPSDLEWEDKYMTERAATYLASLKDPKATEYLLENIEEFAAVDTISTISTLERAYYDARENPKSMAAFRAKKAKLEALGKTLSAAAVDPQSHDGARGVARGHNYAVQTMLAGLEFEEPGKFDKLMTTTNDALAGRHPFFKSSLATMKKDGWQVIRLEDPKADVPKDIRWMAYGGRVGAMTDKDAKRIYLVTGTMRGMAVESNRSLESIAAEVLANELVHVASELRSHPLGETDAVAGLVALRDGKADFKGRDNFLDVVDEEVVSEVVAREARRIEQGGKGKITDRDLSDQVDAVLAPLTQVVFSRHYGAGFQEVSGVRKIYIDQVVPLATSADARKRIEAKIRKLGF